MRKLEYARKDVARKDEREQHVIERMRQHSADRAVRIFGVGVLWFVGIVLVVSVIACFITEGCKPLNFSERYFRASKSTPSNYEAAASRSSRSRSS